MASRKFSLTLVLGLAVLALVACGGGSGAANADLQAMAEAASAQFATTTSGSAGATTAPGDSSTGTQNTPPRTTESSDSSTTPSDSSTKPPTLIAGAPTLPCDALASRGTPCVAAHSVTRLMTSKYAGPLFQLQRMSDNTTLDIYAGSNGMTDVSRINSFCAETSCNFSMLYDQISTNNLPQLVVSNQAALSFSTLPSQMQAPVVTMLPLQFYRNRDQTANIPKGDSALTEYMVVQGAPPALSPCCGTYGNMEATVVDDGAGTMFALALANARTGFRGTAGYGWGPWAGVDLEDGSYRYGPTVTADIVTVLAKYSTLAPSFVVKNGDASQDVLTTLYSGGLPAGYQANWEGGLSLGEGGDGSPAPISFYEGAIIAGASTDQADSAVQTSIASMYGPSSNTLVSGCQANNLVLFPLELIDLRTPGSGGVAAVSPWTPTKVALTQATDPSGKSTYATKITGNYGSQSASLAEKNVVPVLAGQRYVFTVYVLGTNDAGVFPGFSVQTNDAGNTQFAVALNTNSGKAVPGTWGNGKASSLQATKVDSNWWKVDTQFTAPAGSSLMNIFLGPPISDAHGMSSDHSPGLSTTYFCPSLSMVSSDK